MHNSTLISIFWLNKLIIQSRLRKFNEESTSATEKEYIVCLFSDNSPILRTVHLLNVCVLLKRNEKQ